MRQEGNLGKREEDMQVEDGDKREGDIGTHDAEMDTKDPEKVYGAGAIK